MEEILTIPELAYIFTSLIASSTTFSKLFAYWGVPGNAFTCTIPMTGHCTSRKSDKKRFIERNLGSKQTIFCRLNAGDHEQLIN